MRLNIREGSIYPEQAKRVEGLPFDPSTQPVASLRIVVSEPRKSNHGFAQGSALSGVERAEPASFDAAGGLAQDSPERSRGTCPERSRGTCPERSRGTKRVVVSEPRESNHDFAQGQPFDVAQGKPFDFTQGQPFDVAQGKCAQT